MYTYGNNDLLFYLLFNVCIYIIIIKELREMTTLTTNRAHTYSCYKTN